MALPARAVIPRRTLIIPGRTFSRSSRRGAGPELRELRLSVTLDAERG